MLCFCMEDLFEATPQTCRHTPLDSLLSPASKVVFSSFFCAHILPLVDEASLLSYYLLLLDPAQPGVNWDRQKKQAAVMVVAGDDNVTC